MQPDSGCYEERYRVSRVAQRGWSTSLILLPTAIVLMTTARSLSVALVLLVLGAITALPIAVGLAVRRTAFRADYAGITLGADLRDGWALRWNHAVFVPWADVEQIVIYPGQGFPAGSRAPRIGIQRRQDTLELSADDRPAPGCPLPRVTTADTRPIAGWRLDRDRLAAVTAVVAPGVPVVDMTAIDTSPSPEAVLGPPATSCCPGSAHGNASCARPAPRWQSTRWPASTGSGNQDQADPRGPRSWQRCGARRSSSARRAMTGSTRTRSRTRHKSLESPVR